MYHLRKIEKGEFGKLSKVEEEWEEFEDAKFQGSKIMMLVELSDVYGAAKEFYRMNPTSDDAKETFTEIFNEINSEVILLGFSMSDISLFSEITKRAFESGERK